MAPLSTTSSFATRAAHLGSKSDEQTGAILQPLTLATTFQQPQPNVPLPAGYIYSRDGNPNRESLEAVLASLEHGHSAHATPSGTAAFGLIVQALGANLHCLAIRGIYSGTEEYLLTLAKDLQAWSTTFFPFETATDDEIYAAIQPETKVVFLEAPTNPLLAVADIANVVRVVKSHPAKPLVVVDATFSSPYYFNPLTHGADVVFHSTTKYIGGHSDIIGGVAVVRGGLPELSARMRWIQMAAGNVPAPFDCYLMVRSIKTLALRCLQHGLSTLALAAHLEAHPLVESVLYPGLKTHPHHARTRAMVAPQVWKDLKSRTGWEAHGVPFGGVLSFRIKGSDEAAVEFIAASRLFVLAESLGGAESLAKVPWLMTTTTLTDAERRATGLTPNLIRLSVGLEDVDDLLADVDQALERAVA